MDIEKGGIGAFDLEGHWQRKFGVVYPESFSIEEQRHCRRVITQAVLCVLYEAPVYSALWQMVRIDGVVLFGSAARENEQYGFHAMSDVDLMFIGSRDADYDVICLFEQLVERRIQDRQLHYPVSFDMRTLLESDLEEIARGEFPKTASGYYVITRDPSVARLFPQEKVIS